MVVIDSKKQPPREDPRDEARHDAAIVQMESGSHPQPQPHSGPLPSETLPPYEQHQTPTQQPAWSRPDFSQPGSRKKALHWVGIALVVALFVYFISRGHNRNSETPTPGDPPITEKPTVPPSEGKPIHDGNWRNHHSIPRSQFPDNWPASSSWEVYQSSTQFDLTLGNIDTLFFHAYGSNYNGRLTIDSDEKLAKNAAHVEIIATYYDQQMLDTVVCKEVVKNKSQGVGIYGLEQWNYESERYRLRLDVRLTMSTRFDLNLESILTSLSTNYQAKNVELNTWSHDSTAGSLQIQTPLTAKNNVEINNKAGSVNVKDNDDEITTPRLIIHTHAGSVRLGNVNASELIRIQTEAGSVHGLDTSTKWTSPDIKINTSAGSIAQPGETSQPDSSSQPDTSISIESKSGSIRFGTVQTVNTVSLFSHVGSIRVSDLHLLSPSTNTVNAHTDSGSITLSYSSQAHKSNVLHSEVKTNTGSITIDHPPKTFLGSFSLKSQIGSIKYLLPTEHDDDKRKYKIDTDEKVDWMGRIVKGRFWNEGEKIEGISIVETQLGSIHANFL
ncbi:unnamed protein product [Sympodiomycopsis kandeliae]